MLKLRAQLTNQNNLELKQELKDIMFNDIEQLGDETTLPMNGLQQHSMLRSYPIEGTNLNEFDMQSPEMAKQLLKFSIL